MDLNNQHMLNLWQTTSPATVRHDVMHGVSTKGGRTPTNTTSGYCTLPYTRWTKVKQIFHRVTKRLIKPAATHVTTFTTSRTFSTKQ